MDSECCYSSPPRLYDLRAKAEPFWSLSLFVQGRRFETLNVLKSTGTVMTGKLAPKKKKKCIKWVKGRRRNIGKKSTKMLRD